MADFDAPTEIRDIARRLAEPRPMRRGSLSVRFIKCNKPGCPCSGKAEARHGPYTSVVRTVGGKTVSRMVPAAMAEVLRRQIEAGQEFRKDVDAYWDACERWADTKLDAPDAASDEAAKKGGSKRPSRPRSSRRSTRS
jgi:hypothetical protein